MSVFARKRLILGCTVSHLRCNIGMIWNCAGAVAEDRSGSFIVDAAVGGVVRFSAGRWRRSSPAPRVHRQRDGRQ